MRRRRRERQVVGITELLANDRIVETGGIHPHGQEATLRPVAMTLCSFEQ
jgi:hypothetical protein